MDKKTLSFLAFGDLEAKIASADKLLKKDLSSHNFALFTGDIPDPSIFRKLSKKMVENGLGDLGDRPNIARETEPEEALRQVEKEFWAIKELFQKIQKATRFIGVWGNADNTKVLRRVPISKHIEIVHNKIIQVDEFYLIGYNGRPIYIFEKENAEQWAFQEEKAYNDLEKLFEKLKGEKVIFVTHVPPYKILDQVVKEYRKYGVGTYGDKAKDGHIGSSAFKEIDEKFKPTLHVFGHVHECKGVQKVGNTAYINTGSFGKDRKFVKVKIQDSDTKINFCRP
jgi:Icc-related predicted phosphoesterase